MTDLIERRNAVPPVDPTSSETIPPALRAYTSARVGLDRTGTSLKTRHALEFALAHAQARDAVHSAIDVAALLEGLSQRGLAAMGVTSAARNRTEYLRRPDLGRRLSEASVAQLAAWSMGESKETLSQRLKPQFEEAADGTAEAVPLSKAGGWPGASKAARISVILADGLSALATARHALPVLDALQPLLDEGWRLTPVVVAEQARVALGDQIGALLRADVTVMLIGERPGLSSPDSLGAYITWNPGAGRTDAERNCVSNIRPQDAGLDYATAAQKIAWYVSEGRRLGLTGVSIRESDAARGLASADPVPRLPDAK